MDDDRNSSSYNSSNSVSKQLPPSKAVPILEQLGIERWTGEILLAGAVLLISSQITVYTLFNNYDDEIFSPCSVLCASNAFGACFTLIFFSLYGGIKLDDLKIITNWEWLMLTFSSMLYAVIGPLLMLMSLEHISVPQVTIIQRLESVDILVMSSFFLGTNVSWWLIGNAALTVIGILFSILSPLFLPTEDGKLHLDEGVVYTICAGFAFCLSMMTTIKFLSKIPIPIVSLYRSVVGTLLYHVVIVAVPEIYPGELNSPQLWLWMIPYGFFYVCAVQVLLLSAIVRSAPASISVGSNLIFFLSLMWAALLLKSYPTLPETFGALFVALSIVSSVWEILSRDKRRSRSQRWDSSSTSEVCELEEVQMNRSRMISRVTSLERGFAIDDVYACADDDKTKCLLAYDMLDSQDLDEIYLSRDGSFEG